MRFPGWAVILVLLGVLALVPLLQPSIYVFSLLFQLLMYAALATSWNILGGYTGYISFGHVALFGIGGYTTALLLVKFGWSPLWTMWLGGGVAAMFAALVGYPCLRLHGPYFSLVTLVLALATKVIALNMSWMGGSSGLWIPFPPWDHFTAKVIFFEVMIILLALVLLIARAIRLSKIGAGLIAIRENETMAQTIGINPTRLKMFAFITSAFLTGVIGGLYSYTQNYIHPNMMFDLIISVFMVLMALFGGVEFWAGPLIGAVVLGVLDEALTTNIKAEAARIIFGVTIAGVILFMPNGLAGFVSQANRWLRRRASKLEILDAKR